MLMHKARSEFKCNKELQNTTSLHAFIDLRLRDAGFQTMTDDEAKDFAAVV